MPSHSSRVYSQECLRGRHSIFRKSFAQPFPALSHFPNAVCDHLTASIQHQSFRSTVNGKRTTCTQRWSVACDRASGIRDPGVSHQLNSFLGLREKDEFLDRASDQARHSSISKLASVTSPAWQNVNLYRAEVFTTELRRALSLARPRYAVCRVPSIG